ncbi:MAG: hypothetical protein JHC98_09960 [Thermoleophilaceae bacterium]|nr:hypothetical protein [Thermoleophilaceae bacterium]
MLIDPHIALIRTSKDHGASLYEGVLRRVAARSEQPQGVLMHFTTWRDDNFVVGTVFRDSAAMLEGFLGFSAPEAQNEMVSSGRALDMSRDEHRLEKLLVSDEVEARPFTFVPAGAIAACSSDAADISIDVFRKLVEESGQLEQAVPGRLATLAYRIGDKVHAIDFWKDRERGQAWYEENVYPTYERLRPGRITEETIAKSWLELHSFVVCMPPEDPLRRFTRSVDGPFRI